MIIIAILFVLVALFIAFVSLLEVTVATVGVWMVGIACLLAIIGRIFQAQANHDELKKLIKDGRQ